MDSISCRDQQQSILNPNHLSILQYLRSVDVQGTSISGSVSNLTNGTVMASNYMMFYYSMGACICSYILFWIRRVLSEDAQINISLYLYHYSPYPFWDFKPWLSRKPAISRSSVF